VNGKTLQNYNKKSNCPIIKGLSGDGPMPKKLHFVSILFFEIRQFILLLQGFFPKESFLPFASHQIKD